MRKPARSRARRAARCGGRRSARSARARASWSPSAATIAACTGAARSSRRACAPRGVPRRPRGRRPGRRRGSRRSWTAWTASGPRLMPSWLPPHTSGCSTETGLGLPAQLDVALVGHDEHAVLAGPGDDPAQLLRAQYPAGRVGGAVEPQQLQAAPGPGRRRVVVGDRLGAGQQRADLVRRVGQPGVADLVALAQVEQRGQPADQFLGADQRQDVRAGRVPARRARRAGSRRRVAQRGGAVRRSGSRGCRRRRSAPAGSRSGTGSTGVPTERSTTPSGCAAAAALYGSSLSQGKTGRRAETADTGLLTFSTSGGTRVRAPYGGRRRRTGPMAGSGRTGPRRRVGAAGRHRRGHWFCGGSAAMKGWSRSIRPSLEAPPGEPSSSKNSTFAL